MRVWHGVQSSSQTSIWLLFVATFTLGECVRHTHRPLRRVDFRLRASAARLLSGDFLCEVLFALCVNQFGTLICAICVTKMFRIGSQEKLCAPNRQCQKGNVYLYVHIIRQMLTEGKIHPVGDAPCVWIHFVVWVVLSGYNLIICVIA